MVRSSGRSTRPSTPAALVLLGVFAALALGLWWTSGGLGGSDTVAPRTAVPVSSSVSGSGSGSGSLGPPVRQSPAQSAGLRTKAGYVLAVLDATGHPPDGYVGGRQFLNDARGGTAGLPRAGPSGAVIVYREYDVNPHRQGVDRGPQRLVTGSDGSAWMTGDHYLSWQRLR